MPLNLSFMPVNRSSPVLKSVRGVSSWFWPDSVTEGSKERLRRFLLLKLVMVLLCPHIAGLPLLLGCMFSFRVLLLLRSRCVSTKPSTVLLGQLALTDSLVLLHWLLQLSSIPAWWMKVGVREVKLGPTKAIESDGWRETVNLLSQQLLDAHHLASLLLLGLLGLEATLVLRWPQQTRRFRTSRWARLSCSLVWILVLLELFISRDFRPQICFFTLQNFQTSFLCLAPLPSLLAFSSCLRRILWLVNLWLHYAVLYSKPQKRKSFFH